MLQVLEEVGGYLIGISFFGGNANYSFRDLIIFRVLEGNKSRIIKTIVGSIGDAATELSIRKQKKDDRLYFMMLIYLNGAIRDGIWSVGFQNEQFILNHERTSNNDTALATGDDLLGFIYAEDVLINSYITAGTYALRKTNYATNIYAHNAVYESKVFNTGGASEYKDLIEATVTHEPLATAGSPSVALSYRTDQNTSWTAIFTNTTANSISRTAITSLPKDYKEIQFRIVVSGGTTATRPCEITGLVFKESVKGRRFNTV